MVVAFRIAIAILLCFAICAPCAHSEADDETPWPCMVLVYHDVGSAPGAGERSGLRMAIWEDGSILIQPEPRWVTEHILIGTLDTRDLAATVSRIAQAGFFSVDREGYCVPSSGWSTLMVRTRTTSQVRSWHGTLLPGFGGNLNTDEEYRRFVKMWRESESALLALTPLKVERLKTRLARSKGTGFRGYNPADPFGTPWMHARNWRSRRGSSEKRGEQ